MCEDGWMMSFFLCDREVCDAGWVSASSCQEYIARGGMECCGLECQEYHQMVSLGKASQARTEKNIHPEK